MAHVRSWKPQDVWAVWLPPMRKAAVCGLGVLALTSIFVRYTAEKQGDLLASDLERTVMSGVHIDETW